MSTEAPVLPANPRERLLQAAYGLFSTRGVRDVGVDEVIEKADVAKATLYKHFGSKDDLVHAFLRSREQRWTVDMVEAESHRRGSTPQGRLLAIFDVFDDWFHRDDFEACSFVNVLLEMGRQHRLGQASIQHLENIREIVRRRAEQAQLREPEEFAHSWHIVMKGSIIAASEGDRRAAHRGKAMARRLIEDHS